MKAFGATAQDCRIAGLEAERSGVGGNVGARFINNANDAQWYATALDTEKETASAMPSAMPSGDAQRRWPAARPLSVAA